MIIVFSPWICRSRPQGCYLRLLSTRLYAAERLLHVPLFPTPLGRHAASDAILPLGRHAALVAISHGRGAFDAILPLGRHATLVAISLGRGALIATLPPGRHATLVAISLGRGRFTARVLTWHEQRCSGFGAFPGVIPSGRRIRTTMTVRRDFLAELPPGQVDGLIASHSTSTGQGPARTIQELMRSTIPTHLDSGYPHEWVDEGASSKGIRPQSSTLTRLSICSPSGSPTLTARR